MYVRDKCKYTRRVVYPTFFGVIWENKITKCVLNIKHKLFLHTHNQILKGISLKPTLCTQTHSKLKTILSINEILKTLTEPVTGVSLLANVGLTCISGYSIGFIIIVQLKASIDVVFNKSFVWTFFWYRFYYIWL